MSIGEISEPIKKQDKIIFLKLDDKRSSDVSQNNFETLREKIINQKKNELFNLYSSSYLSKLRNTKFIEYKNEFRKKLLLWQEIQIVLILR